MPSFEEILQSARTLSAEEQAKLARELQPAGRAVLMDLGPMANRPPAPHSVAWVKSERGHAVLATDTGPAETDIPQGAAAIAGMWRDMAGVSQEGQP